MADGAQQDDVVERAEGAGVVAGALRGDAEAERGGRPTTSLTSSASAG